MPLLGGDGWDSPKTVEIGGKAVEGVYFTNHYSADDAATRGAEVHHRLQEQVRRQDARRDGGARLRRHALMADAIKRAGSTDGPKIRDALAATKDFPGVSGNITIDAERNARKAIVVAADPATASIHFVESIAPDAG